MIAVLACCCAPIVQLKMTISPYVLGEHWSSANYASNYSPPPDGYFSSPDNHFYSSFELAVTDYYRRTYSQFDNWVNSTSTSEDASLLTLDYYSDDGVVVSSEGVRGYIFLASNLGTSQFDDRIYFTYTTSHHKRVINA